MFVFKYNGSLTEHKRNEIAAMLHDQIVNYGFVVLDNDVYKVTNIEKASDLQSFINPPTLYLDKPKRYSLLGKDEC